MFGNLGKIMQLVGRMKTELPELQARLAESQYTADAGGGAVTATVNGKLAVTNVVIDPELLADGAGDAAAAAETLADVIKAAVSAAQKTAADAAEEAMKELTGGMDLSDLGGLLGQ